MDEMQETGKWYEDVPYQECKSIIKERLASMSRDFIAVGYYLKYIRDKKLYKEDGYASVWEFAESNYGIKMSTASRWMAMNLSLIHICTASGRTGHQSSSSFLLGLPAWSSASPFLSALFCKNYKAW